MNLAEFSVRQTVLVNVLFFVCLLGGIAAWNQIPVEFFPDFNLNEVEIYTTWTGSSAEEVERLVTQKLEEELGGVADVDEMRSTSQADISNIVIEFDEYLDELEYQSALNDVRAALDRVEDLPADAEEPVIIEIVSGEVFPVVSIALVDEAGLGQTALRQVARDIEARVDKLPGVNRASIRGEQEREIRIFVDRNAAARYGLTVVEVAERIRRKNLNVPAGTFKSGGSESIVRARGDYQSLREIGATVVRENPSGGVVRLSDVARIEDGLEKRLFINRFNTQPAQIVTITKKNDADVLDLSKRVEAWIESYRPLLPEGLGIYKTVDTAEFVGLRMSVLANNLLSGVVLVILILWFTIGFRNAVLTSIAIPFSFLTAMIFFPILDISINSVTVVGLLLVSGMLVDDAIIVLENVYRRVEEGEELTNAVVNGTKEVMWPVICAVTTTIAAFAPLLLVGGTAGKFVAILPKAVIVCLAASLFECLIILPAHYLDFGSRRRAGSDPNRELQHAERGGRLRRGFAAISRIRSQVEGSLDTARGYYTRALDTVLTYRGAFATLLGSVVLFSCASATHLAVDLFPGEFDTLNVLLESPAEFSLEQTNETMLGLETQVEEMVGSDLVDFSTTVGFGMDSNYDRLTGTNLAMSFLTVRRGADAPSPDAVLREARKRADAWREKHPGGIAELRVDAEQDGPPVGPPVEVRIQGDDYALGKTIAGEMIAFLRTLPGVTGIEDNLKIGPSEVRLIVDDERASRYGLAFEDMAQALRAANDGLVTSRFRDPGLGEDVDIRVLLEERYRGGLQDLLETDIRTPAGYLVKLRDVADVEVTRGFRSYRRYDERRTVSVYADIDEEITTSIEVNRQLKAAFADVETRYPEVQVRYGGEYEESNEALSSVFAVFPIALLAIYMILAALFRSYLQPLMVTVAIPFGFAGVVLGVGALGYKVSFIMLYAAIGLTGVVVNDSLVMVDFINRARAGGMPMAEAIRSAGAKRFRPVFLTTLTTVVALLPMAYGLQGESKTYGPFAATISFGLFIAMAGTLLAVPLAYSLLTSAQIRSSGWLRDRRGVASDSAKEPASKLEVVT